LSKAYIKTSKLDTYQKLMGKIYRTDMVSNFAGVIIDLGHNWYFRGFLV